MGVMEYSDKECKLAKDGGESALLQILHLSQMIILTFIVLQATHVLSDGSLELVPLASLTVLPEQVLNGTTKHQIHLWLEMPCKKNLWEMPNLLTQKGNKAP